MVDDTRTRELILKWIDRAQIDYSDLYLRLYIAYNAWFRRVTGASFDKEGIARLTKRFVIWDDYLKGKIMQELRPIHDEIASLTQRMSLSDPLKHWNGIVTDSSDWQNLIHFWYQVRCDLFHGNFEQRTMNTQVQITLAYLSLNIFMTEISRRMKECFTAVDLQRLTELNTLINLPTIVTQDMRRQHQLLQQKYIHSHDMWAVDAVRV